MGDNNKKFSKYIFIRPRFYDVWFTSLCRKYKSSEMLKLSNTLLSIIQNFDYIHQITKQKCNKFCANRMQSEWKKRRSEIKRNKKNKREKEKGLTDQWLRDLFRLSVWLWRKRERCTCKCKKFLNSVSLAKYWVVLFGLGLA